MQGIIILGAGLSGLGCARLLPGAKVYEAMENPGGHAYSHSFEGMYFDEGAHICHSKDKDWLSLLDNNTKGNYNAFQSRVANYWFGNWVSYPVQNHLHELPIEIKIKALTDLFFAQIKYNKDEVKNYHEWCLAQYGQFLTEEFYHVFTEKYWRVPMEKLGTDWLSGRLLPSQMKRIIAGSFATQEEDQSTFNKFKYPNSGGFYSFIKPLYKEIDVTYNYRAIQIDIDNRNIHFSNESEHAYEALVSSIPLTELIRIIHDVPEKIKNAAEKLRYTQLLCVNMIVNRSDLDTKHWFYVYDPDIPFARVSVPSSFLKTSLNKTAIQAESFRRNDEEFNVDLMVEDSIREMAGLLHFNPSTELAAVQPVHVPYAYIISDLQRAGLVEFITKWLAEKSIFTMGLYGEWKYVWSDMAFRLGEKTATIIKNRYGN